MTPRLIHNTLFALACAGGMAGVAAQQPTGQALFSPGVAKETNASAAGIAGVGAPAPPPSDAARYVQACQEALQKGQPGRGCNNALFTNELQRLEGEALKSQHPALLTLVGEAYRNERSPNADIGQAYRWYLMAAVRGDPQAMERLSQMYQKGQGVAPDPVRALGYARLTQVFANQPRHTGPDIANMIQRLGSDMAAEEIALSERFAQEMEARIRHGAAAPAGASAAPATRGTTISIPGLRQSAVPPAQP